MVELDTPARIILCVLALFLLAAMHYILFPNQPDLQNVLEGMYVGAVSVVLFPAMQSIPRRLQGWFPAFGIAILSVVALYFSYVWFGGGSVPIKWVFDLLLGAAGALIAALCFELSGREENYSRLVAISVIFFIFLGVLFIAKNQYQLLLQYIESSAPTLSQMAVGIGQILLVLGIPSAIIGYIIKRELELIRADLELRNKFFDSVFLEISQTSRQAQERKLQAISVCWARVISLEDYCSVCTTFFDLIAPSEDYASQLKPGKPFHTMISKKSEEKLLAVMDVKSMELERPFLTDETWFLYRSTNTILGRICLMLMNACKNGTGYDWKKDDSLVRVVQNVLTLQEFEYIMKMEYGSCGALTALLKQKLLAAFAPIITGKASTDSSLSYIEKFKPISDLLKKEKK